MPPFFLPQSSSPLPWANTAVFDGQIPISINIFAVGIHLVCIHLSVVNRMWTLPAFWIPKTSVDHVYGAITYEGCGQTYVPLNFPGFRATIREWRSSGSPSSSAHGFVYRIRQVDGADFDGFPYAHQSQGADLFRTVLALFTVLLTMPGLDDLLRLCMLTLEQDAVKMGPFQWVPKRAQLVLTSEGV
ncbi:hypothetical protein F5146DRAFT_997887 [Armillaria mellea]|nr:hypothetical protein F5146DRAFT_997887 [Armillaria mellea]